MGWKDRAKEMWDIQKTEHAKLVSERSTKQMELLVNTVKTLLPCIDSSSKVECKFLDNEATVIVDNVEFVLVSSDGRNYPAIRGKCPKCGEMVKSWGISDLKQLGKYLEKFEPCGSHVSFCHKIRRD